jgi:hypothetical protein
VPHRINRPIHHSAVRLDNLVHHVSRAEIDGRAGHLLRGI